MVAVECHFPLSDICLSTYMRLSGHSFPWGMFFLAIFLSIYRLSKIISLYLSSHLFFPHNYKSAILISSFLATYFNVFMLLFLLYFFHFPIHMHVFIILLISCHKTNKLIRNHLFQFINNN